MKKITILLLLFCFITLQIFSEGDIPKNSKIIGLNGTANSLCITLIDLSNNEIVVVVFYIHAGTNKKTFLRAERMGIIVNPNDYKSITMADNMFDEKK